MALWLQATLEGIGSARELDRRCETDIVYRWILGGVTVNYHTLSDFRSGHGAALDELFSQVLGLLIGGLAYNLGYRQAVALWRLSAIIEYLGGYRLWGRIRRLGFRTARQTEAAA